jgi:prepilin-type N-terminal cleavage/methylation domain-containing protein
MRKSTFHSAFTLVEVMVASGLGAVILASVLSTYIFLARNLARLSSYQALEQESRKALSYLAQDFRQARTVKNGTTPTASTVTLVLPAGEVSYTFDATAKRLRREATFGANRDFYLLRSSHCECTTFGFRFFTTSDAAPTDQSTPEKNVPFSIKQIEVGYIVESPSSWSSETRTRVSVAAARYLIRNRGAPDGN